VAGGEEGGADAEDRTEAPTPKRIERARSEGQVPLSRDAVGLATLLCATVVGMLALPAMGAEWLRAVRVALSAGAESDAIGAQSLAVLRVGLLAVLPVLLAVAVSAVAATMGQTGGLVHGKALAPSLSRLNPLAGFKRLFGLKGVAEVARGLAKMAFVGAAVWHALDFDALQAALHRPAGGLLDDFGPPSCACSSRLGGTRHHRRRRRGLGALAAHAPAPHEPRGPAAGNARKRGRPAREGPPPAPPGKPGAAPDARGGGQGGRGGHQPHALRRRPGLRAGAGRAARDRRQGRGRHGGAHPRGGGRARVPIVPNPPLARALWRLEVDTEIPAEHWQAVAEIIAYVLRLRRPRNGRVRGVAAARVPGPFPDVQGHRCCPNVLVSAGRNPHTLAFDIRSVTARGRGDRTA
jgi:flagellar biosynthetic protein FlhB